MGATNDKILPLTRWVSLIVIPFLWLAFLILYFFPDTTGERFAWAIKPHMTALYMGAGYLGGSWLFINALVRKRWHHIQGGFWPITTFTWFMMVATFIYWERFVHANLGFILWLILYVVTPFLVPFVWFINRKTDSGEPEADDVIISPIVLWLLRFVATGTLLFVAASIVNPDFMIQTWPWTLSPLTALVMCGWIALLAVGALVMSFEPRWSGWKVPLGSIVIWHVLVLIGAGMNLTDFKNGVVNWYTVAVVVMVGGIIIGYLLVEGLRRRTLEQLRAREGNEMTQTVQSMDT
jgi:hypothetical protein